jgi:cation transport regulator ChaB
VLSLLLTMHAAHHAVLLLAVIVSALQRLKEQRERRSESLAKKRAMRMASQASKE